MKTAIIIPTVRRRAAGVAQLFLKDAAISGLDLREFSLYFSIDPPLFVGMPELQIDNEYISALRFVRYIDQQNRADLARRLLSECEVDPLIIDRLIFRRGYASARNSALIEALMDGNDFVVNIDDDVLPIVPRKRTGGQIEWIRQGVVKSHFSLLASGFDVTQGGYLGYTSPVVDLSPLLSERCLQELGKALSMGNEVLKNDCLLNPALLRTAPPLCSIKSEKSHAEDVSTERIIFGGNLGISLKALRQGRIPPFYCPPNARGEDTFFGASLAASARIVAAQCPVFHDPFNLYSDLLDGSYPGTLLNLPDACHENLIRFADAFRGWIRYAPLWLRCQHDNQHRMNETLTAIEKIYLDHGPCLDLLGISDTIDILRKSISSVDADYRLLLSANLAWCDSIVPYIDGQKGCR